jgi:hypothetical protein
VAPDESDAQSVHHLDKKETERRIHLKEYNRVDWRSTP